MMQKGGRTVSRGRCQTKLHGMRHAPQTWDFGFAYVVFRAGILDHGIYKSECVDSEIRHVTDMTASKAVNFQHVPVPHDCKLR